MTGIVGHAIGHVTNKAKQEKEAKENKTPPKKIPEQDINGEFGLELLKALAGGGSPQFGAESASPRAGRSQASQSHIDAINRMTGKKTDSE